MGVRYVPRALGDCCIVVELIPSHYDSFKLEEVEMSLAFAVEVATESRL